MYTKLRYLRYFNSSLFKSQVTNVLTEVVPFCKSGHICILEIYDIVSLVDVVVLRLHAILFNVVTMD